MSAAFNEDAHHQGSVATAEPDLTFRAQRRVAKIDHAAKTITTPDSNGANTYHLDTLDQRVKDWCMMTGAWTFMRMSDNPDEAFARLMAGNIPRQRGEPKPKKPNAWRLAMAHALVEETKKSDTPVTLPDAIQRATNAPRDKLIAAKLNPTVAKHYHRLNGNAGAPSLSALI